LVISIIRRFIEKSKNALFGVFKQVFRGFLVKTEGIKVKRRPVWQQKNGPL